MGERQQRRYGQDQPWREERRPRYPDEPHGGEREWRSSADERQSPRGRDYRGDFAPEGGGERPGQGWGHGYGYGFGDSGSYRGYMGRGTEGRWHERDWNTGGSFGFGPEEDSERSGNYTQGSPYGRRDWSMAPSGENYAGLGPKDYRRSDDRIREEICDILTDDPRIDPSDVVVKVESGDVTLMGTVGSRDQKRRAEEIAERVRGVHDVNNQLRTLRAETTTGTPVSTQGSARGGRASVSSPQPPSVAHERERER